MQASAVSEDQERKEVAGFGGLTARLNWLRAAVLGANDGAVSGSGLMIGVAAADPTNLTVIMIAGIAGLVAGALSMAMGEYVSVSSQRDTEDSLIVQERELLRKDPEGQFQALVDIYVGQGLSAETARTVATELTDHDALAAHLRSKHGVHEEELTTPWHAAVASGASFTSGFMLPIIAMLVSPAELRIPVALVAAVIALAVTGYLSATFSESPKTRPVLRNMIGGTAALIATWVIGHLFGVAVG